MDKKDFENMRSVLEDLDAKREEVIKLARVILKSSKKSIFSCHRGDLKGARKLLDDAKKDIAKMESLVKKNHDLSVSLHSDALEEYCEAETFYHFLSSKKLPTSKDLNVSVDVYLQGLCDLSGEVTRKAVNDVANGDESSVKLIKNFVSQLYEELMQFDFRNSPLRRKFDSVKYALEKLEDLSLRVKLK